MQQLDNDNDCEPQVKKLKHSVISDFVLSEKFQKIFRENWHNFTDIKTDNLEIISKPFRVCRISNFIGCEELLMDVRTALMAVKGTQYAGDLYKYEQTTDFTNINSEHLTQMFESFQVYFAPWLRRNTNIPISNVISMSSSCYYDTDYLLCHDDNMGDRRIAYVLYISKQWTEEDGGALDLFDTDDDGLPRDVVKSLVPQYNSLVFFEVTDNSYHQVAEVTSVMKSRCTINGWFHGPKRISARPPRQEIEVERFPPLERRIELREWISEHYLEGQVKRDLSMEVERESYAFVTNFLKDEVYDSLSAELLSETIVWKKVGPADLRKYEVADEETLPETLKELCNLFKSISMFELLKEYTELDLVPGKNMHPKMNLELQRWSNGCYTLMLEKPIMSDYNEISSVGSDSSHRSEEITPERDPRLASRGHEERQETPGSSDNRTSPRRPPTPGSVSGEEDEMMREILMAKSPHTRQKYLQHHAVMLQIADSSTRPVVVDTDSESDIGDYLSDHSDRSNRSHRSNPSSQEEKRGNAADVPIAHQSQSNEGEQGEGVVVLAHQSRSNVGGQTERVILLPLAEPDPSLDLILQFHTSNAPDEGVIDYMDPMEGDPPLTHIPTRDNFLSMVYRTGNTIRLHKYINHYFPDYFYNLVCTYYE